MKRAEVKVGGKYRARVSGKFVTLRVDRIRDYEIPVRYEVTNLDTGRQITLRSAARLRYPVS